MTYPFVVRVSGGVRGDGAGDEPAEPAMVSASSATRRVRRPEGRSRSARRALRSTAATSLTVARVTAAISPMSRSISPMAWTVRRRSVRETSFSRRPADRLRSRNRVRWGHLRP